MKTTQERIHGLTLAGIALSHKTVNEGTRAMDNIGGLWQRWMKEGIAQKIPNKISNDVYAVYHSYEGDHTRPYSYFIGCKVSNTSEMPEGFSTLIIPSGVYTKVIAKGKLPEVVVDTWQNIWSSDIKRSYKIDFEIYDKKSADWSNGEVDIYLS